MMTLIAGGSGSGKSAYAENYILNISNNLKMYYLATMQVYDEEGLKKVARHRELRKGKGFLTIEKGTDVKESLKDIPDPSHSSVLLECMSNLTANEMFREDGQQDADTVAKAIVSDMQVLCSRLEHLVIVTNNVFEDGIQYDASTMEYIRALGNINHRLAGMADNVIEVVAGIPVMVKEGY